MTENFLHRTKNVTEWMKKKIEEFVAKKGYKIALIDVDASIMTRMGKITVMNTVSLKMIDGVGKVVNLDGYASVNKEYEDMEQKWLVDFIKEREIEALLMFGGETGAVHNEVDKTETVCTGTKKFGSLKLDVYFSSTVAEMVRFLTDPAMYVMWMGPSTEIGQTVRFENIEIRGLSNVGSRVEMEYRWREWDEFSHVVIDLLQVGANVKVALSQTRVPVSFTDNVKNHWNARIFPAISGAFQCAIKRV